DTIYLQDYKPNLLTYKSSTKEDRVAVFSEIYYPAGWDAFIDNRKVDYFRADYVLRAMNIPAGDHTVTFRFEPSSYKVGNKVSLASSVILLLLLLGIAATPIIKKSKNG
ncbi:MAG TPA: YfhO family protein, partial [Bacteroidales bacterium]|nr:YfhO family protein [Bacteroidales bacterium]